MKNYSRLFRFLSLIVAVLIVFSSCSRQKPRVLVFTRTMGFHHNSITQGVDAIKKLGDANSFIVDTTSNPEFFTEDSLKRYATVIFLNTTGDILDHYQEAEFERYIQAGGGFVGVHAAADTEYDWGWYGRLVGAYFLDHPGITDTFPNVQEGILRLKDDPHPAVFGIPREWKRTDEFYSFKKISKDIKVLMTVDESSYRGGKNGNDHPMSWYHDFDGGRSFYTNLGHTEGSYSEENYLKHLLGGIQYAIGDNDKLNYSKAHTQRAPDEDRFSKTMLIKGQFFEPTEMTILPNLDILVAQRRGEIMLSKKGDSIARQVGYLPVYWKTNTPGVNAEEGLLGIQADPNFEKNHYVFIFYSPLDTSVNRLSRFKFENNVLDMKSEKVVLQFYSQREICCHTGGSIAFDKDGLLYLSTGDNSTPFDEPMQPYTNHGYAPLDDRPGHEQYDARRSSGNPNDLRGKILRIRVKEDGSYEIPEGNLYPVGTPGTRPEIYVQGNRNPYRISVDKKNSYLYWGEVGPDASNDSLGIRGPRGYDEVNQARKAGFFGWPLFIGDNYAYHDYDYKTGKTGPTFDPAKPVNASRNNSGIQNLPEAQPAFIWYPYAASAEFPQVKTGGRNAMAGPVYYTDMFPEETRLPDYYDKKLIIYDWIRGWIKAVTMLPNGDFDKMEPFMAHTRFNAVIDMEVGPDGKLYLLEYGSGWFTKNEDAGLARIDYNGGNRAPKIAGIRVDQQSGSLPFRVALVVDAKDPERNKLKYKWHLGDGVVKETDEPVLDYTFDKAGEKAVYVEVTDSEKSSVKSETINLYAGNDAPEVKINITGNRSFYFPGRPVSYSVSVQDKNDPAAANDTSGLFVSADYVEGIDKAGASMGHQVMTEAMTGKILVQSMDCKACHKQEEKSVGPSYLDVAKRYEKRADASQYLASKIIKGSVGTWGEVAMPAHADMKESDVRQIVAWIQSLTGGGQTKPTLPSKGSVNATLGRKPVDNGVLVLAASYTDKGGANIKPLTANSSVTLRSAKLDFRQAKNIKEFTTAEYNGALLFLTPKQAGSFSLDSLDLTDIKKAELKLGWQKAPAFGYGFELRLDGPEGKLIGETKLLAKGLKGTTASVFFNITPVTDGRFHNIYIVSKPLDAGEPNFVALGSIQFE